MLKWIRPVLLCWPLVAAGPVHAQVTQTFTYDGAGRLTGVATSAAGGTHGSSYVYDDVDNRLSRSQVGSGVLALNADAPIRFAALGLQLWERVLMDHPAIVGSLDRAASTGAAHESIRPARTEARALPSVLTP